MWALQCLQQGDNTDDGRLFRPMKCSSRQSLRSSLRRNMAACAELPTGGFVFENCQRFETTIHDSHFLFWAPRSNVFTLIGFFGCLVHAAYCKIIVAPWLRWVDKIVLREHFFLVLFLVLFVKKMSVRWELHQCQVDAEKSLRSTE